MALIVILSNLRFLALNYLLGGCTPQSYVDIWEMGRLKKMSCTDFGEHAKRVLEILRVQFKRNMDLAAAQRMEDLCKNAEQQRNSNLGNDHWTYGFSLENTGIIGEEGTIVF